jgi:hypothetical protein
VTSDLSFPVDAAFLPVIWPDASQPCRALANSFNLVGSPFLPGGAGQQSWSIRVQTLGGLSSRGSHSSGCRPSYLNWNPASPG